MFTEEQNEVIESAAEMLYGLIHVRYILKGMAAMLEKYKNYGFGRCSGVYCCVTTLFLPVGQSDIPRSSTVKIYCPCKDIYYPRSKYQGNIDGEYFGTMFPHLFLMTYGHGKQTRATFKRVFGFKLHKS